MCGQETSNASAAYAELTDGISAKDRLELAMPHVMQAATGLVQGPL